MWQFIQNYSPLLALILAIIGYWSMGLADRRKGGLEGWYRWRWLLLWAFAFWFFLIGTSYFVVWLVIYTFKQFIH